MICTYNRNSENLYMKKKKNIGNERPGYPLWALYLPFDVLFAQHIHFFFPGFKMVSLIPPL